MGTETSKGLSLEALLQPEGRDAPLMCVRVPARASHVGVARRLVKLTLGTHGAASVAIENAVLIVSEMVTNVVRHNDWDLDPVVVLVMSRVGSVLRIEVLDSEPTIPKLRELSEVSEAGRGLHIVQTLSSQWGIYLLPPDGKVVWCELDAWPSEMAQV